MHAQQQLTLELDLRRALKHGELARHYQPKVLLASGATIGCEALLRWTRSRMGMGMGMGMGMVPPESFITVAEDFDPINDVGAWGLREACWTAVAWNTGALQPRKVAVNLSARQIQFPCLVAQVH
ncbi:EAL domain-containing protein [Acidovorax sp. 100]|uniref:EAL domain-containing protein n=1 Tax=Acidovorax sp. 100 TaxID=2135635 RepID=UPI001314018B|nr:EAL domain-containing protein [Acidovorax sp. 100]